MGLTNKTENSKSVLILIQALILLCGILVGAVAAAFISADTANALTNVVSSDMNQLNSILNNKQNFLLSLWSVFKYPLFIFLLSFSFLGIVAIPLAVLTRGFSLGFSIGSIIKIFGPRGILFSLASFGFNLFAAIPCLLIMASISFSASYSQRVMFSKERRVVNGSVLPKGFFIAYTIIFIILALVFTLDIFITPFVLNKLI